MLLESSATILGALQTYFSKCGAIILGALRTCFSKGGATYLWSLHTNFSKCDATILGALQICFSKDGATYLWSLQTCFFIVGNTIWWAQHTFYYSANIFYIVCKTNMNHLIHRLFYHEDTTDYIYFDNKILGLIIRFYPSWTNVMPNSICIIVA